MSHGPSDLELADLWASCYAAGPGSLLTPQSDQWDLTEALKQLDSDDAIWAGIQGYALRELEPPEPRPWRRTARSHQLPPAGRWRHWLIMAGRGWGKTHTGANVLAELALSEAGDYAIVAPTLGDAKKICVEGPSGLLVALGGEHGDNVAAYNRSDYTITLSNGSRIVLGSADAPDRIRGWNLRAVWCDEVGSWRDAKVWNEGVKFATRIGDPRIIITTTPTRGNKVLTKLLERFRAEGGSMLGGAAGNTVLTRGSTRENIANLSSEWLQDIEETYAGTALGRQELDGELLSAVPGALITMEIIEQTRLTVQQVPDFWRIAVAVDPSVTNNEDSDECGILVAGIGPAPAGWTAPADVPTLEGAPHVYWLEDCSIHATPESWARRALQVAEAWSADVITAEVNNGGDLVSTMISMVGGSEGLKIPRIHQVHAAVGKRTRAEPVGGMWQQHRVHSVGNNFKLMEDQWQSLVPGSGMKSPDRLDASVWGAVELVPSLGIKPGTPVRLIA